MYKIYLSPSTQDKSFGVGSFGSEEYRMNQIADVVEQELLLDKTNVVYRNKENMTKNEIIQDSNNNKPDIHIAIHSNFNKVKGPSCYTKIGDEISNGLAKETYKEIINIYYDKENGNGVIYDSKIKEIMSVRSPAILIEISSHNDINDAEWIVKNISNIGKAIVRGIYKAKTLKVC